MENEQKRRVVQEAILEENLQNCKRREWGGVRVAAVGIINRDQSWAKKKKINLTVALTIDIM